MADKRNGMRKTSSDGVNVGTENCRSSSSDQLKAKYGVHETSAFQSDAEEAGLLNGMCDEAKAFIGRFKWCGAVNQVFCGFGVGRIVAVFLFDIENLASTTDNLLWVIVGDIPPAYLVVADGAESPRDALIEYVQLMSEWVTAVENEDDVAGLIPVNAGPTKENASALKGRLKYIQDEFIRQ